MAIGIETGSRCHALLPGQADSEEIVRVVAVGVGLQSFVFINLKGKVILRCGVQEFMLAAEYNPYDGFVAKCIRTFQKVLLRQDLFGLFGPVIARREYQNRPVHSEERRDGRHRRSGIAVRFVAHGIVLFSLESVRIYAKVATSTIGETKRW